MYEEIFGVSHLMRVQITSGSPTERNNQFLLTEFVSEPNIKHTNEIIEM